MSKNLFAEFPATRIPMAMMLGLFLLAAGCSTNGSHGAAPAFDVGSVQGSQWELVSLGGTPVIESGNKPTLTFPFLQLLGSAGQMKLEGDRLNIQSADQADAPVFQRKPAE